MPAEHPLGGQRPVIVLRGIEHHLDHPLDVPVGRRQRADVDAEAAGDRGAHLVLVEDFAFDFRGLEDIFRQGLKDGLFLQAESQSLHAANEPPLAVAHGGQTGCNGLIRPAKMRPVPEFVDVRHCSPHDLR